MNDPKTGATSSEVPDVSSLLAKRGVEFTMGMDIPRQWATGAQAFLSPETTILVFREQHMVGVDGPGGAIDVVIKNVASVVLPTSVLREIHRIIGDQLGAIDDTGGK